MVLLVLVSLKACSILLNRKIVLDHANNKTEVMPMKKTQAKAILVNACLDTIWAVGTGGVLVGPLG